MKRLKETTRCGSRCHPDLSGLASRVGMQREHSPHGQGALSRRRLLRRVTGLGAGAVAFPYIVRPSALGLGRTVAPSNRITIGVIGTGGKGTGGMRNFMSVRGAQVVAVCDVMADRRAKAAKLAKIPLSSSYNDFRDLLARSDVDAVLIATPDHWHVLPAIAAAKAGKDIYCEKPLSNTVAEGRALVKAVKRYGRVFQHGTQLKSRTGTRLACELVRSGRIGRVKRVLVGSPPGSKMPLQPTRPVPAGFDFDLWLGPAPEAPYTPYRVGPFPGGTKGWYFISDYSKAGWVAGHGVHDMDIAQWGLGMELSGPVEVEGRGVFPTGGLFNTVLSYRLEYTYANGVKIIMTDTGGNKRGRPPEKNRHGVRFEGTKGWVFTRGGIEAGDPRLLREKMRPGDVHLYASKHHEANFIECVKTRRETITPVEVAHRSTSAALIGGIALKLERKLHWDPETERFRDDEEANRLLTYAMRPPWRL